MHAQRTGAEPVRNCKGTLNHAAKTYCLAGRYVRDDRFVLHDSHKNAVFARSSEIVNCLKVNGLLGGLGK